jgi:hypothetical protein
LLVRKKRSRNERSKWHRAEDTDEVTDQPPTTPKLVLQEYTTVQPNSEEAVDAFVCSLYHTDEAFSLDRRVMLVNQETERALKANTVFLLYGHTSPVPGSTWALFQVMKKIVQSSCPLQNFLTAGVLRLFKYYLLYSEDMYPHSVRFKSAQQQQRILSRLRTCHNSLSSIDLKFGTIVTCKNLVSKL